MGLEKGHVNIGFSIFEYQFFFALLNSNRVMLGNWL